MTASAPHARPGNRVATATLVLQARGERVNEEIGKVVDASVLHAVIAWWEAMRPCDTTRPETMWPIVRDAGIALMRACEPHVALHSAVSLMVVAALELLELREAELS